MDDDLKWFIAGTVAVIVLVGGAMLIDGYQKYSLKSKCIEMRGEWIGETCIFRTTPPLEQIIVPKVHS